MKKLFIIALLTFVAAAYVSAQEGEPSLKLSGQAKTGILYEQSQQDGGEVVVEEMRLHSKDDAGGGQGRFRMDMDYDSGRNIGFRARLFWESWNNDNPTRWGYAFGYGNFFNDTLAQITVSVGKLGGSPWGTGGDMWKELEDNNSGGGMRVEWKPAWDEAWGKLNLGFVLNYFNQDRDQGTKIKITMTEIFKESVIGVSYTHDYFMARLAYRLDSEVDANQANKVDNAGIGEDEMVYRVEEHALKNYLPGLQLWALGHLHGLSAKNREIQIYKNWFFAEYNPPELLGFIAPLTAQFSVGYDAAGSPTGGILSEFFIKPGIYVHLSPGNNYRLITVGSLYKISFDFGDGGIDGDNPYYYMELEPKVQLNFQSSYIAFAYQFRQEYKHDYQALPGREPIVQKQWINLRFCIYF